MTDHYVDTSALAKHYHPELGSTEMDRLWNDPEARLLVSRLAAIEIVSVFAGKVRTGAITADGFQILRRRFFTDLTNRRLVHVRITGSHYQEAERLLRQHGPGQRLRTLDALQLAVALDLHRRHTLKQVISSDKGFLAVAVLEGLPTFDPENP